MCRDRVAVAAAAAAAAADAGEEGLPRAGRLRALGRGPLLLQLVAVIIVVVLGRQHVVEPEVAQRDRRQHLQRRVDGGGQEEGAINPLGTAVVNGNLSAS